LGPERADRALRELPQAGQPVDAAVIARVGISALRGLRYPQNLAGQVVLEEVQPGVYRCRRGTDDIRVVVLRRLPQVDHNALWHLFSAVPAQVDYGAHHYRRHSLETSTLLQQLFGEYQGEGIAMPYTMEDFRREYVREHLHQLTPEERLEGLATEEIVKNLSAEEILQRLPREVIENFLRHPKNGSPSAPE
jgi:hypothetical protein